MEYEWICGLPFVSVPNERMEYMLIGEIVEDLIAIKNRYEIRYPYDEAINNACNILDRLPRNISVYEWLENNGTIYK